MKNQKEFIVELLIVLAILAALTAILLPVIEKHNERVAAKKTTAPAKTEAISAKDEEIVIYDSSLEKDEEKEITFKSLGIWYGPIKADKVEIFPSGNVFLVTKNGKKKLIKIPKEIDAVDFGKDVEVSIVPSFPSNLPEKPPEN